MNRNPPSDLTVFNAALELRAPHERQAYLDTACGCDTQLREKVAALLAAAEGGADALDRFGGHGVSAPSSLETPGQMIGRYKVMKQLGEGGHGVVYEAEQEEPIRRRVALKVIKAGMDTKAVIARFEAERQALAMMDHPNIAKVFDAGSTDTGRPYFVMEMVNGAKVTDYCRQHSLPICDRLALFLQVCDAVQHAHQKGIIHRDLKPSNILVRAEGALGGRSAGPVDQEGAVRSPDASGSERPDAKGSALPTIIDFGIAKSLAAPLTEATIHTGLHQLVGTPAYMSPEQADLRQDLDTRTDIYSLGVLLYELLTGRPPFDNHELLNAGLDEMRRIIREVEPRQPSQCLKSEIPSRNAALDPDLDSIVLKCLEKDRSRRYQTAASLALDIQRHLRNEPVLARPPSATYRLGKFVRRNRTVCISAGLVALAILTGALLAVHGLVRERRSRQDAEHRLHAALAFVNEITDELLPKFERLPGASALNESWAQAALKFTTNLLQSAGTDPETAFAAANVLVRLGRTEITPAGNNIGRPERALTHAREALAVLQRVPPDYRPEERLRLLKEARNREAVALEHLGQSEEAIQIRETEIAPLMQRLVDLQPDQLRPREEQIHNRSMIGLDLIQLGRERDGIDQHLLPLLETAWARSLTTNSESYSLRSLASIHGPLAVAYTRLRHWPSVIHHAGEAARWTALLAEREPDNLNHHSFLSSMGSFKAHALVHCGAMAEGLSLLTDLLATSESLLQRDPSHGNFREVVCIVLMHRARALAFAAMAAEGDLNEKERRVVQAAKDLAQVDAIIARSEQEPTHRQFLKDLADTRVEVRAAEAHVANTLGVEAVPADSLQPPRPQ